MRQNVGEKTKIVNVVHHYKNKQEYDDVSKKISYTGKVGKAGPAASKNCPLRVMVNIYLYRNLASYCKL